VGATTLLTGLMAVGALLAFALAARLLARGSDPYRWPHRRAGRPRAFAAVIFAAPLQAPAVPRRRHADRLRRRPVRRRHADAAMGLDNGTGLHGLALGAWGAVQATCAGVAMAFGGALRDAVGLLAGRGSLGEALQDPVTGYGVVYLVELALLFATLAVIGPLVRRKRAHAAGRARFGLTEFPG
jgi:BCD family chlorophyll transporter-like MFS transporter